MRKCLRKIEFPNIRKILRNKRWFDQKTSFVGELLDILHSNLKQEMNNENDRDILRYSRILITPYPQLQRSSNKFTYGYAKTIRMQHGNELSSYTHPSQTPQWCHTSFSNVKNLNPSIWYTGTVSVRRLARARPSWVRAIGEILIYDAPDYPEAGKYDVPSFYVHSDAEAFLDFSNW